MTSSIPTIVNSLVDILIVAACKGPSQHVHGKVTKMFGDRIRLIVELAFRLNQVLGQQVTSSDLEIAYIAEDVEFDPTVMDDICNDNTTQNSTTRVICTTELGLRQTEKENKADNQKTLLKPKVALNSVTDTSNTAR